MLKDVPKTLVYELCEYRNSLAGHDLIPQAVIDKPPSAELRPDQRDDESLPPYAVLDPILEGYVEQDLTVEDLVAEGFDAATVRRIIDLVDHAEYKRRQAPPGPRVTSRGFGKDRRMPITNHTGLRPAPVQPRVTVGALNLLESARCLGGLRAVELTCFARLGERAPRLAAAGVRALGGVGEPRSRLAGIAARGPAAGLDRAPGSGRPHGLPAGALADELARVLPGRRRPPELPAFSRQSD